MLMVPVFSSQVIPGLMRIVFMAVLAFVMVVPIFYAMPELTLGATIIIALKELVLGLLMGYLCAVAFWSIEAAGLYIDNQRGATMANSIDPLSGSQASVMGDVLLRVFITYFLSAGGMAVLLGAFYLSFELWDVFSYYPRLTNVWSSAFLGSLDVVMKSIFALAAPVIIAMLLTDLSFALMSRFIPQLNVFSISFTLKSWVALVVLMLYLEQLFSYNNQLAFNIKQIPQGLENIFSGTDPFNPDVNRGFGTQ